MKITRIKLSFSNAYLEQDLHTILVDTGLPIYQPTSLF
jgi:hypothetical protein